MRILKNQNVEEWMSVFVAVVKKSVDGNQANRLCKIDIN